MTSINYYDYHLLDEQFDYIISHPEKFEDLVEFLKNYEFTENKKGYWVTNLKRFINNWHLESYLKNTYKLEPLNPTFDHFELRKGDNKPDMHDPINNNNIEVKHLWNDKMFADWYRHLQDWVKSNYTAPTEWYVDGKKRYISKKTKLADEVWVAVFNKNYRGMTLYRIYMKAPYCPFDYIYIPNEKIKEWRY